MERKGICENIGICSLANSAKIQSITDESNPFICMECGLELKEVDETTPSDPQPPKPLPWKWIILAVIVLGGVIVGVYFGIINPPKDSKISENESVAVQQDDPIPPKVSVESLSLNKNALTLKVNQEETLTVTVLPDNATNKAVVWSSSDESIVAVENGKVTAAKKGTAVITVTAGKISATASVTVENNIITLKDGDNEKTYPFGKYVGKLVNGRPDGQGTMTYTRRVQIAKHARQEYHAEAGDIFVGTWGNGDIVNGNLYDSQNNQKAAILAGKRPNPYDISKD